MVTLSAKCRGVMEESGTRMRTPIGTGKWAERISNLHRILSLRHARIPTRSFRGKPVRRFPSQLGNLTRERVNRRYWTKSIISTPMPIGFCIGWRRTDGRDCDRRVEGFPAPAPAASSEWLYEVGKAARCVSRHDIQEFRPLSPPPPESEFRLTSIGLSEPENPPSRSPDGFCTLSLPPSFCLWSWRYRIFASSGREEGNGMKAGRYQGAVRRAFTLVEILVTLAILAVSSSCCCRRYKRFGKRRVDEMPERSKANRLGPAPIPR